MCQQRVMARVTSGRHRPIVESRVFAPGSITLGNGNNDLFNLDDFARASGSTITLGNGNNDLVNLGLGLGLLPFNVGNTISLGNGNNDTVMASTFVGDTITVGNGNDTIYVGRNDTVTVGTGQDSFIF